MSGVLVAYFSRTGSTERLALQLAQMVGADIELVKPLTSYAGTSGYFKGIWHSLLRHRPTVSYERDAATYPVVIIGSPVWVGHICAPIRTI